MLRKMRLWWPVVAVLSVFAGVWLILSLESSRDVVRSPNLIIVSVDTLNKRALKCYNSQAPSLPALDRFTEHASVFTNAVSTASWTLPAHASLLTGLYPDRHAAIHSSLRMLKSVPTLSEILEMNGYQTVAFTDAGLVHRKYGFGQGFQLYNTWHEKALKPLSEQLPRQGRWNKPRGENMFDRAISYISNQDYRTAPFFLFVHSYAVHDYFLQHPWALRGLDNPRPATPKSLKPCLLDVNLCSTEQWSYLRDLYQSSLKHMDKAFGRLLNALRQNRLLDNSVVVFLSDHGEAFSPELDRIHHGGSLHPDLLNIPLVVSGPGIGSNRVMADTSIVDVMPTVLKLLDLDQNIPAELDGRSQTQELTRSKNLSNLASRLLRSDRHRFAFEFEFLWKDGRRMRRKSAPQGPIAASIMNESIGLVIDMSSRELFSINGERSESRTAVHESENASTSLRQQLQQRLHRYRHNQRLLRKEDAEIERQLRGLGYLN